MIKHHRMATLKSALTLAAAFGLTTASHAATVAGWDFENITTSADSSAPANIQADLGADAGSTSLLNPTSGSFSGLEPDNATPNYAYAGPGDDTLGTSTASNYGLRLGVGSGGTADNGSALVFNSSTAGFSGITVNFDAYDSNATGFSTVTLLYSTTGVSGTFNTFTNDTYALQQQSATGSDAAGYSLATFDLSSISALNNDPNAAFELVFSGAQSYTGSKAPNTRLDNLIVGGTATSAGVSAVPEPSSLALLGLGLLPLGLRLRKGRTA